MLRPTTMVLALACAFPAHSAEKELTEGTKVKIADFGAITVTAGRGSNLQEMDMSTTIISRDEVRLFPETSVDQIVNKIPGVFASQRPAGQIHPTGQVFSIRGFGTTTNVNTLVMVDGIPINDPYFRTLDWAQVPKDAVERIEVIRGGGATSMWGNLAMGGIVNIVTREPASNENRVHASYGSFNTKIWDVAATLFSSETLTVGIGVGGANSDGYQLTPSQYRNSKMSATASETGYAALSAYYRPSRDSTYYVKLNGHTTKQSGQVWDIAKNSWEKIQISGGGSTRFADGGSINMHGWYNEGEMTTANANTTPAFSILSPNAVVVPYYSQIEQAKYDSLGGSLFYQKDFGSLKDVKVGFDFRNIKAHDNNNFYKVSGISAHIIARAEHGFSGVFAQGTYRPVGMPLDITLGLRQDHFRTLNGNVSNEIGNFAATSRLENKSYSQFDPRLGAKYYFANGLDVRAAVYRNFAAPGMNQMYRSTQSGTNYLATNEALTPQANLGQEIGFDYVRPGLDVAFTMFRNKLKNYIDYVPVCRGAAGDCDYLVTGTGLPANFITNVNQYVNAGDAILKGAELLVNWEASKTVKFTGGVTRTIAYLTSSDYAQKPSLAAPAAPVNAQLGQVPQWMATLGSSWQTSPGLTLSLQFKAFPSYWNNTAHTQRNSSATLADLGVSYKVSEALEVYGAVQNLGNKRYYDQGLAVTTKEGTTLSTGTIPALGMPFNMTMGVRASF